MANDFDWLAAANVAIPAYNVDEPRKPLEMSKERNLFKLFYSDVGLLTGAYLNSTALDILAGDDEVNYGAIYENVVAQELTARGFLICIITTASAWENLIFSSKIAMTISFPLR